MNSGMDTFHLPVSCQPAGISVTDIRELDRSAYLEHFREREIHERTLRIPFPYNDSHAEEWIGQARAQALSGGRPSQFAIRNAEGKLIGGIGLVVSDLADRAHQAELGYWLAKPLWGRGIMTASVRELVAKAMGEWGFTRLTATTLATNLASARVLEKNGFLLEGILKNHYSQTGPGGLRTHYDGKLYALVRH